MGRFLYSSKSEPHSVFKPTRKDLYPSYSSIELAIQHNKPRWTRDLFLPPQATLPSVETAAGSLATQPQTGCVPNVIETTRRESRRKPRRVVQPLQVHYVRLLATPVPDQELLVKVGVCVCERERGRERGEYIQGPGLTQVVCVGLWLAVKGTPFNYIVRCQHTFLFLDFLWSVLMCFNPHKREFQRERNVF